MPKKSALDDEGTLARGPITHPYPRVRTIFGSAVTSVAVVGIAWSAAPGLAAGGPEPSHLSVSTAAWPDSLGCVTCTDLGVRSALTTSRPCQIEEPGTVIESSPLPSELWLPGTAEAHRVTYTTTGSGEPATSSGLVFIPTGTAPAGGWPVIAWAHGTVGDSDADAPSRSGVDAASRDYVAGWLQRGYAVAATDYVGLGTPGVAPYLDGVAAAHAVIDSVRAARHLNTLVSARWAAAGLSEGGHAAVFVASLASSYAPELDFRGAVANGVPSNIESLAPLAGPWFPPAVLHGLTDFMTFVIAGLRASHPELNIDSYLTPLGLELVEAAPSMPYEHFKKLSAGVAVSQMLARSLDNPELLAALRAYLQVPINGFDKPLMIVQGITDTVVPAPLTLKLVLDMLFSGSHPDFRVYPGDHIQSMYEAEGDAHVFIANLF